MEPTLRPLTLGEILDRTAQLYRTNFLLFAGIAAIYAGALLLISLLQILVQEGLRAHHMDAAVVWATVAGTVITFPIILICGGLAVAANNRAVAWLHLGQTATIRGAYAGIRPRLGRFLWLMTITTFVVWAPCVVLYAGFIAFVLLYVKPRGGLPQPGVTPNQQVLIVFGIVAILFALLLLGAVIYATLMGLRYSLAVPACVVEDIPARAAIRRSIELSKGARGRIFLLGLLVAAIDVGLLMVTQIFFIVAAVKHGELSGWMRALQQVVEFFTNTFVGPIYAIGFTLFYYDQRVRKEGFDIEWMMQAAGLGTPAAAAPAAAAEALPAPDAPPAATEAGRADE